MAHLSTAKDAVNGGIGMGDAKGDGLGLGEGLGLAIGCNGTIGMASVKLSEPFPGLFLVPQEIANKAKINIKYFIKAPLKKGPGRVRSKNGTPQDPSLLPP